MRTILLAFHGFTSNGTQMRTQMGQLVDALGAHVEIVYPDAPHACDPDSVDRFSASWESPRAPPLHLTWWDASSDGTVYRGWDETREMVRDLALRSSSLGVLGFSQGAMLAASIAALSSAGQFPPLRFAVLVAGRLPRAKELTPLFDEPVRVPSLHVWGEADRLTGPHAQAAAERFDAASRETVRWKGPHVIPTAGPAGEAIVDFVRRHA